MSAALRLNREEEKLSRKPPLGEKVAKPRLVWENPDLSHGTQKEKPKVRARSSYGRVLYNYFRDYNPATGRYVQSDPIGLQGGLNTYAYVGGNPQINFDSFGLTGATTVDAWCGQHPVACASIGRGSRAAARASSRTTADTKTKDEDDDDCDCGPDTRMQAYQKALSWAGTDIVNDWDPIPWNQYRGRGGQNYTHVRQMHPGANYGYTDPRSRAKVFDHPDGHPHQVGPEFPDHHKCPHYHAVNSAGEEQIFKYERGT